MDAYVGLIMLWPNTWAPQGWLSCQGQQLPIVQNQVLYAVIGNQFGGDGRTYFNLPDLRSRVPVGITIGGTNPPNLQPYQLNQQGGEQTVTLQQTQIPAHVHPIGGALNGTLTAPLQMTGTLAVSAQPGTTVTPGNGNVPAKAPDFGAQGYPDLNIYGTADSTTTLPVSGSAASGQPVALNISSGVTGMAGGTQPHDNMPPYIGMNYIICTEGLFPPRP